VLGAGVLDVNEIFRIVDQLEREHGGEPWHGSSLTAILRGVDHRLASSRPTPGAHTIWELVLHITAWKNEVRRRLGGEVAGEPADGDWPAVGEPSEPAWKAAIDRLQVAHRLLVSAVRDFPEAQLSVPTNDHRSDGIAPAYYELILGVIQHDVYHSGQIAILKKHLAPST